MLRTTLVKLIFLFSTPLCFAQTFTTNNNYTGMWDDVDSWVGGNQPAPLTNNIDDNISIYGYISTSGSLNFDNVGQNRDFYLYDTLVVYGSLTFDNSAHNFYVQPGALLVVFGDLTATNKIAIANGGIIVVTQNMSFSASGQDDFDPNVGSSLFVDGNVTGNADAAGVDQPTANLAGTNPPLYNFITNSGSTPLPIVLSYFKGKANGNHVNLSWETLSEENFDHFEIQRSHDGRNFEVIGRKQGNGFTTEKHQYSFIDNAPKIGMNYYRLNAIDFDGSFEIFETIAVEVKPNFSNVSVYPNPSSGNSFEMQVPEDIFNNSYGVTFSVSDLKGQVITSGEITSAQVSTTFDSQLKTGIYLVTIQTGTYSSTLRLMVN